MLALLISAPAHAYDDSDNADILDFDFFEDEADIEVDGFIKNGKNTQVNSSAPTLAGMDDDPEWDASGSDDLDEMLEADPIDDLMDDEDDDLAFVTEDPDEDLSSDEDDVLANAASSEPVEDAEDKLPTGDWFDEEEEDEIIIPDLQ